MSSVNTLKPRENGWHIFLEWKLWILIKFSLKFVPEGPNNNIPALLQIMAWRNPGDRPLSEPTIVSLPTHIWVTRPQWVNSLVLGRYDRNFESVISEHMLWIEFMSTSCEIILRWMPQNTYDKSNIGSGNGLVLLGNKPLLELVFTQICAVIWRHKATMS